jgi:hypothetical protein
MAAHKIGPWSDDDWKDFLALDVELQPPRRNTLSGLLGIGGLEQYREHQQRTELVAAAWKARHSHQVYKALVDDLNFRQAWNVFERRRKVAGEGKLAAHNAPFVFLHEMVEHAGYAYQLRKGPDVSRGGHAKRRRAATRHADALTALLSSGIRMKDYIDTDRLRTLLKRLSDEMRTTRRKDYGGKRYMARWLLKGLAYALVMKFDLRSPAIVCHFARMVDLACETKTAQRYCAEAEKEWRRRLIAAQLAQHELASAVPGQESSRM